MGWTPESLGHKKMPAPLKDPAFLLQGKETFKQIFSLESLLPPPFFGYPLRPAAKSAGKSEWKWYPIRVVRIAGPAAKKPGQQVKEGQKPQTLAQNGQKGSLPGEADGLRQHIGQDEKSYQRHTEAGQPQSFGTDCDDL